MRSRSTSFALAGLAGVLTLVTSGCNTTPALNLTHHAAQAIYWDLFAQSPEPGMEETKLPLTVASSVTDIQSNGTNLLRESNAMAIDSMDRLWVMSFPTQGEPEQAEVFTLPLTQESAPVLTFTFPGANDISSIEFDANGNLWGADFDIGDVYEFAGPFTTSGALDPAVTLAPGGHASGLAFDSHGDLFVSNGLSTGSDSIAVYSAPIGNAVSYYLDGVSGPGGLIFDSLGDLYVGNDTDNGVGAAIDRFSAGNQASGDTPDIVDPTGMNGQPYAAAFAFDSEGNLYDADCGNTAATGVRVYAAVATSFSSTEAPSIHFQDGNITTASCVWGIAIH